MLTAMMLVKMLRSVFTESTKIVETRHLISKYEYVAGVGEYELKKIEEEHRNGVNVAISGVTESDTHMSDALDACEIRIRTGLIEPHGAVMIRKLIDELEQLLKEEAMSNAH